jgi:hypothetical protein
VRPLESVTGVNKGALPGCAPASRLSFAETGAPIDGRTMRTVEEPGFVPRSKASGALRVASALAFTLFASGCADMEREVRAGAHDATLGTAARYQREIDMNRQWQNRPLSELVASAGKPKLTMNIPGGGNPPGFVVVYGVDDRTGCIDAFAMNAAVTREPTVRIYHCR